MFLYIWFSDLRSLFPICYWNPPLLSREWTAWVVRARPAGAETESLITYEDWRNVRLLTVLSSVITTALFSLSGYSHLDCPCPATTRLKVVDGLVRPTVAAADTGRSEWPPSLRSVSRGRRVFPLRSNGTIQSNRIQKQGTGHFLTQWRERERAKSLHLHAHRQYANMSSTYGMYKWVALSVFFLISSFRRIHVGQQVILYRLEIVKVPSERGLFKHNPARAPCRQAL